MINAKRWCKRKTKYVILKIKQINSALIQSSKAMITMNPKHQGASTSCSLTTNRNHCHLTSTDDSNHSPVACSRHFIVSAKPNVSTFSLFWLFSSLLSLTHILSPYIHAMDTNTFSQIDMRHTNRSWFKIIERNKICSGMIHNRL